MTLVERDARIKQLLGELTEAMPEAGARLDQIAAEVDDYARSIWAHGFEVGSTLGEFAGRSESERAHAEDGLQQALETWRPEHVH